MMSLAQLLALMLLLVVGGYIFAVGILPQIFAWIFSRLMLLRARRESHSPPTVG
ncbi:MAG: hypothetical protein IVW57_09780 [Ktedonobacterales bacterium]|nr:hypothetical protein [Ktedonobacterales bacterium]